MYEAVTKYCLQCHTCQNSKISQSLPGRVLQSHDIRDTCWATVTKDFVNELPRDNDDHDAVFVVMDKLSKRTVFIPLSKTADAATVAHLLRSHVFCRHGTPRKIISDRDPILRSKFWQALTKIFKIELTRSTVDHPEIDGQSGVMIKILSAML